MINGGLARQPIVDGNGVVQGYELLFRGVVQEPFDGELATATVLVTAACDIGWDRLGGDCDLFINVDCLDMLERVLDVAPTERTVIELVETLPVDEELVARLEHLRSQGLRLALDDFVEGSAAERLLPMVDVVKLDVLAVPPSEQLGLLVQRLHEQGITVVAEKVEDDQMHQRCVALGFDLFQGYWYGRPITHSSMTLSPTRVLCLRLLGILAGDEPDLVEVERLIMSDTALIVRTLRMVNSASVSASRRISSVRQAVVLIGPKVLTGWMALMLLAGQSKQSGDLIEILVRARTCETVARRDLADSAGEAFLCGLISGMSQRTGVDLGLLLDELGATEQMRAALVHGEGRLGQLVHEVDLHLAGEGGGVHLELAHLAALAWTNELTRLGS